VVLPVFNGERYLQKALNSVLVQEYTDYEFLICDDASFDNSIKIIESNQDKRIKFFKNRNNQGLFPTLNMLIRESRGEYVRLWSQDDIMKPSCLKEEASFYGSHPQVGFCYCARDIIDEEGKVITKAPEDKTPETITPQLSTQIMFYYGSIAGNIANVTIKRSVLDSVGLFREDMKAAADFEMWVKISERYPIGFIRKSLIELRSHRGQFSRQKGMGLVFIQEQKKIFQTLSERLPLEIRDYAKAYAARYSLIFHINYMIRSFLSGDFNIAKGVYEETFKRMPDLFLAIGLWLITINGRLFKRMPRFKI